MHKTQYQVITISSDYKRFEPATFRLLTLATEPCSTITHDELVKPKGLYDIFDRAPTLIIASYYSKNGSYYIYVYNIQQQLYHWILLSIRLIFLRSFHSIQTPLAPTVTTPTSFASFMKLLNYMLHLIRGFITDKDTEKCVCIYLTRKLYIYFFFNYKNVVSTNLADIDFPKLTVLWFCSDMNYICVLLWGLVFFPIDDLLRLHKPSYTNIYLYTTLQL